jgi:deoxyribonuclease V
MSSIDEQAAPAPLAIVDVHYAAHGAGAACVVARDWADEVPEESRYLSTPEIAPYVPGQFYLRELPPIINVLKALARDVRVIVVDGYVVLDEHGSPGLGAHLYQHFDGRYAVVGVAKTSYRRSTFAVPVIRGSSRRPLFVTSMGMSQELAARSVARMHGEHRIPTLMGLADRCARGQGAPR